MNNIERKIQLLRLLGNFSVNSCEGTEWELEEILYAQNLDYHDICFLLFIISEYARIKDKPEFINKHMNEIVKLQQIVLNQWEKPYRSLFHEEEGYYSSNIGMAYGSLYNSNLYIKNEAITQTIKKMKNYVYDNYSKGGKLVTTRKGSNIDVDLLWLCIPFGLFTPEDLVLVEAVKEMDGFCTQEETALLSWYFAEKPDYKRAKIYLGRIDNSSGFAAAIKGIIEGMLSSAGALLDCPIQHVPLGTNNRYEPRHYERSPWYPKTGDEITLNAVLWPAKYPTPVYVCYLEEGGKERILEGKYQEDSENYKFELGSFEGGTSITYYFYVDSYRTEDFTFDVLKREHIVEMRTMAITENRLDVQLKSDLDNVYQLEINDHNKRLTFSIKPMESGNNSQTKESNIENPLILGSNVGVKFIDNKGIVFETDSVKLTMNEIYFWRDKTGIFSYGIEFDSDSEEGFYGFGERYNHINQRGNVVDVYVYNQYKDQGIKTYFPMPYFLSSRGYGLFADTSCYTSFDLCRNNSDIYSMETQVQELTIHLFIGCPKEVIHQFSDLTGKPVMIPEWAFGPWMSSNNWDSDEEVRKQVELTKKYDIPSTVLVIEAWSDEATYYIFNDAVYKEKSGGEPLQYDDFQFPKWGRWPDPKGMVSYLHENGLKCILWQIPIIKSINSLHHIQNSKDKSFAVKEGYCVKNQDGTPYRIPEGWFTHSMLLDFTNKDASEWWFAQRDYLVDDIQIDGFKTDGGEFIYGDKLQFSNGKTGKEMRNEYPNLYIEQYYDYINEKRDGIAFSRAGFTGAAKMPAHWAGDEKSTFSAFRQNLCAGLNAGISGVPFWGWDLGGFSGEIPSAELFIRSAAMATFCPIMQYHAESKAELNQDRTPWNIAERWDASWVIADYRFYAKLRMAMIPYIMEQAEISVATGIPMMRAMLIEFPMEKEIYDLFDQYMFGEDLLVAPIVKEGEVSRDVYVPSGEWVHLFDHREFHGGNYYNISANVHEIIVLQRAESKWKFQIKGEQITVSKED